MPSSVPGRAWIWGPGSSSTSLALVGGVTADAAHDETVMAGYSELVTHLREQVSTMQQQGTDRQATDSRIDRLEDKLDRAERAADRHHRVGTRAVDLAEKQHAHIRAREDARQHHDPDGLLDWVPRPTPELLDREIISSNSVGAY